MFGKIQRVPVGKEKKNPLKLGINMRQIILHRPSWCLIIIADRSLQQGVLTELHDFKVQCVQFSGIYADLSSGLEDDIHNYVFINIHLHIVVFVTLV